MDEQTIAITFYGTVLFLVLVVWRDRVERNGILFLKRTKEGVDLIESFGSRYSSILQKVGNISLAVGVLLMVASSLFLVQGVVTIFSSPEENPASTIGIVVPGIHVPGSPFYIPLVEGIIAIATVVVFHEFSHGIFAAAHGVSTKSLWLFLLLIIPGAGVELDETKIMRKGLRARLHIYSAGSFANILCAVTAALLIRFLFVPAFDTVTLPVGIEVTSTTPGLPAAVAGIPNNTVVTGIEGRAVVDYESFLAALEGVGPNETIALASDKGPFLLTTALHPQDPTRGYLGVVIDTSGVREVREEWTSMGGGAIRSAISGSVSILYYMFMLHISIGIINLLPVFPLDGGRMLVDLAEEYGEGHALAAKVLSSAMLFLFILNIIGPHAISLTSRLLS